MSQIAPKLREELDKMSSEPLLAAEKKLIIWSLCLGIGLLVVLIGGRYIYILGGA